MEFVRSHHPCCSDRTSDNHASFRFYEELESCLEICNPYCSFCEKEFFLGGYCYKGEVFCVTCIEEVFLLQQCQGRDYRRSEDEADVLICCSTYVPSFVRVKRALSNKKEPPTKQIKV